MKKYVFAAIILVPSVIVVGSTSADYRTEKELAEIRARIAEQGLNWTADLNPIVTGYAPEERQKLLGLKLPENWEEIWHSHLREDFVARLPGELPAYFNWEDSGKITPVKYQGSCGSCWDFAATAALEAIYSIYRDTQLDLSEQAVLSCATPGYGCGGASMDHAYHHFEAFGAFDEADIPYHANDDIPCTEDQYHALVKIEDWTAVNQSRQYIKTAVMTAPVAVAFNVYSDFFYYSGGCYSHPGETEDVNHAVLVVGWDDNMCNGEGAWRAKNSWGEWWGDDGYFWIQYGHCNFGYGGALIDIDTLLNIDHERNLPVADMCHSYDFQLQASGGREPYRWILIDGGLPQGTWLDPGGVISGIPETPGGSDFAVKVVDSSIPSKIYFKWLELTVNEPLCGDADCNGIYNMLDIIGLIGILYKGAPIPGTSRACDCNCSYDCNMLDILYLISFLYKGGSPPCAYK
jgi:C1A family cysteine protease